MPGKGICLRNRRVRASFLAPLVAALVLAMGATALIAQSPDASAQETGAAADMAVPGGDEPVADASEEAASTDGGAPAPIAPETEPANPGSSTPNSPDSGQAGAGTAGNAAVTDTADEYTDEHTDDVPAGQGVAAGGEGPQAVDASESAGGGVFL